jgi:quercetin dioxygenase-like cupin family protein
MRPIVLLLVVTTWGHDRQIDTLKGSHAMPLIKSGTISSGNLKGKDHGATISLILDEGDPGHGPRLHRHPYDETWVVISGNLTFHAGDKQLTAEPGDVVIVPPDTPHKFTNDGPGRSRLVCIHAHPTFETEWLE